MKKILACVLLMASVCVHAQKFNDNNWYDYYDEQDALEIEEFKNQFLSTIHALLDEHGHLEFHSTYAQKRTISLDENSVLWIFIQKESDFASNDFLRIDRERADWKAQGYMYDIGDAYLENNPDQTIYTFSRSFSTIVFQTMPTGQLYSVEPQLGKDIFLVTSPDSDNAEKFERYRPVIYVLNYKDLN